MNQNSDRRRSLMNPTPDSVRSARAPGRSANPLAVALAAMTAMAIIMGIGRFALTPILPLMLHEGLVDLSGGGWLATVNYIGYFVGAMLSIAIRRFPRQSIRWALGATVALTVLMGVTDSLPAWLALRFLGGVVTGLGFVAVSSWCLGWLAFLNQAHLGGIMFVGPGAGILVSGVAGGVMLSHGWHPDPAWLWSGVLAAVCSLPVWALVGRRPPSVAIDGRAARPAAAVKGVSRLPGNLTTIAIHIIAYGTAGFGYIITATFLPVMVDLALPDMAGQTLLWPLFGFCIALGSLLAVRIPAAWNHWMLLAVAYLLQAGGVAATFLLGDFWGFALGSILLGLPCLAIVLFAMREARRLGGARAVQLMGALTASYALGQIIGPPLATYLVERSGGFDAPLGVASAALLAGALLYGTLYVRERVIAGAASA